MQKALLCLGIVSLLGACGKDDDSNDSKPGAALNAPQVQPPVADNLPSAMKLFSYALEDGEVDARDGALSTILSYMSTANGNVSPTKRLEAIDTRMASLDSRAQENAKTCLESAAAPYTWPGEIPAGASFPLSFQCLDNLDGSTASQLAFGLDDTHFHLYERSSSPSKLVVMAKAPLDGKSVEVYQAGIDVSSGSASWVHIVGSDTDGVEIAYGGEAKPFSQAMVCGVQVKTNGDLIYATGKFYSGDACGEEMTFCLNGISGEELADTAQCTAVGLDNFTLTKLTPDSSGVTEANTNAFINTLITGITDFAQSTEE